MYAYRMVKIQSCFKVRIILPLKFLHHNFVLHCEIWHFLCALTKTSMTTSLSYIFLSLLELLATILESPQYYPLVYFTAPVLYVKCKINQISCVYIFIFKGSNIWQSLLNKVQSLSFTLWKCIPLLLWLFPLFHYHSFLFQKLLLDRCGWIS